jgi:CheY-like chemotaxis protein
MLELLKISVSKHATLETDLRPDLPAVSLNAAQVRQIVMNLVTNASEAMGEKGGVIRVSTRRVSVSPGPSATFLASADQDYVQLEVSDTGGGISPETRDRVFDPFFTTKSAGRGLGLAVVSGIVRSFGGHIYVASEPGKGTTFQISMRCAETEPEPANDNIFGEEDAGHLSRECTVLVVEDEVPLRQAVVKKLRNTGFEVLEAPDGSAAIDLIKVNGRIDVILLDLTIPGTSSAQVIIEAAETRPEIRVILTSAYSQETVTTPLNGSHVCAFIRKPFQLQELVRTVRRASSVA